MHGTSSRTTRASARSGPQHVVSAISHLREAAADLDRALAFTNIPGLFAAGSGRLCDLSRDLEALLAQLDAMRLQLAEYIRAVEDDARPDRRSSAH